jgi:hypothetical protein
MAIMYPGGSKGFYDKPIKNKPAKPMKPPFQPKVKPGGPILLPGSPKSAFPKLASTNQRMVGGITKTGGKLVNPTYNTY